MAEATETEFQRASHEDAVNGAIALFSGEHVERAKEIWLVEKAPKVIEKLDSAIRKLDEFMKYRNLILRCG